MGSMKTSGASLVLGLFDSVQRAAGVLDSLIGAGMSVEALGVLMSDRAAERAFGRPEVRDAAGATSAFSGHVHRIAGSLKPMAALSTAGAGLVAAGPLAPALVSAGLGSRGGLDRALEELGIASDAPEVARKVKNGAVLVSLVAEDDDAPVEPIPGESTMFWRVPLTAPLATPAVIVQPLAGAGDQSARYTPVIESPDQTRASSQGASKLGT